MSRHFLQVWAAMRVMVMCMYQLGRDKKDLMSWGSVAEHVLRCGQRRLDVSLSEEEWRGQASSFNWELRRGKAEGICLEEGYLSFSVLECQTSRSSLDVEIRAETCTGCHSLASD